MEINSDIKGPIYAESLQGNLYILTFIDDFSRFAFTFNIKTRDKIFECFEVFKEYVENTTSMKIKEIQTDNGREFMSRRFENLLLENSIRHVVSSPYTPEENGIAERFNRTLQEKIRVLLLDAKLNSNMWETASNCAVHLYNRSAHAANNEKSPYEIFHKEKPRLAHMKPYGCLAFPRDNSQKDCFHPANHFGIFVGYPKNTPNAYLIYLPHNNKIITSRKVKFLVHQNISNVKLSAMQDLSCSVPDSIREAKFSNDWKKWREAMKNEINSIEENNVYELVDLPKGRSKIRCRWVFSKKFTPTGDEKFKARLVAKGFSQKYGVDFKETFSPTAYYDTIRLLIALSAKYQLKISQMDVSTAFLNAELTEEIYMEQPPEFINEEFKEKVWKLKKSLYGLKQAPREWNKLISGFFKEIGLTQLKTDNSIFAKINGKEILIVLLYVDDLLIFGSDMKNIEWLQNELLGKFKMNKVDDNSDFIGFEIKKNESEKSISISQNNYVSKLLEQLNFIPVTHPKTPMETGVVLSKIYDAITPEEENFLKDKPYRSIVGSLNYLANGTRPDIAYATHQLSRHLENTRKVHWYALERVINYLRKNSLFSITYKNNNRNSPIQITAYSDADWGGDTEKPHSISGYAFILNCGIISWACKRQETIARSSTEAEFVALDFCSRQASYLTSLCKELTFTVEKIKIFGDNMGALRLSENPIMHQRTKHINIKYHAIREMIINDFIELEHIGTENMIADALTKSVPYPKLIRFMESWGMRSLRGCVGD